MTINQFWRKNNEFLDLVADKKAHVKRWMIIGSIVKGLLPYFHLFLFGRIVDLVTTSQPQAAQKVIIILIIGSLIGGLVVHLCERKLKTIMEISMTNVNTAMADTGMQMPYAQIEDPKSQDAIAKANRGINANGGFETQIQTLYEIMTQVISIMAAVVLVVLLFCQSGQGHTDSFWGQAWSLITLIVLYVVIFALSSLIAKKYNQITTKMRQDNEHTNTVCGYYLFNYPHDEANSKDVRIGHLKQLWQYLVGKDIDKNLGVYLQWGRYSGLSSAIPDFLLGLATGACYIFIGGKAQLGQISVGEVMMYAGAINTLTQSVMKTVGNYMYAAYNTAYLEIVSRFIQSGTETAQPNVPTSDKHEIEFEHVWFSYPGSSEVILKDISLTIQPGQKVAIVGRNGAGKSTFVKLLCRLYQPTKGVIKLDGQDIRTYDATAYYQLFSVVFQDFVLFDLPLGANVAGAESYDTDRVKMMLQQAGLQDRLQAGLTTDTQLGKDNGDGTLLSGGESQKVALARALYKDAPLVILDEPTSALDPYAEADIYQRFDQLTGDKTAIYISHRMSSCRFCNHIIVFDGGKIVQQGSHQQLVEQQGLYQQLWQAQAKYYQVGME